MREGGKAVAGGCSEKFISGILLYCHLCCYWDKITGTKQKGNDDDEGEMPREGSWMRCGE